MRALVTETNLGAWLLRCNPKVWNLPAAIEDGDDRITGWSVVDNYRSRMMRPGHKVVLWVSGTSSRLSRGIWGLGHITGEVEDEPPDVAHADEVGYWLNDGVRLGVTNSIDVDIVLMTKPLTDVELRAAGISDLEVQRQPQFSNPSWVSKEQLARITSLLPSWPGVSAGGQEISIISGGAAFGDPVMNKVVEAAAMAAVSCYFETEGWMVTDVSMNKVGWDLTCSGPAGQVKRVEVKGVRGERPTVLLTANELQSAKADEGWVLAVVTRAISRPKISLFDADETLAAAKGYIYRATMCAD